MAERALLARKRDDGRYVLRSSRWGGTNRTLARVFAGQAPDGLSGVVWQDRGAVAFPALVEGLDYLATEVLYRVRDSGTTVFIPLWFGLPLPDIRPAPGIGALVAVDSLADARRLRRRFRALKGSLADAVTDGRLPAPVAPLVLQGMVASLDGRERYLTTPGNGGERLYPDGGPDGP